MFDRGDGNFRSQSTLQRFPVLLVETVCVPRIRLHDVRQTYATLELSAGTHLRM